MAQDQEWETARLIPVSGIRGAEEQERRAASAFLATLGAVREFGRAVLRPLGAPAGRLESYAEVPFEVGGKKLRVDGIVRATRGSKTWTLLIEIKTGSGRHTREQVESYLEVVRAHRYDGLLTISNDISPVAGRHPVEVDQRRYRNLGLHHLSWFRLLSTALLVKEHEGVSDPDQAWLLGELIRYLEHPNSGAMAFEDMGGEWVTVRNAVPDGTLRATDKGTTDVAARWDQLLQWLSLHLTAQLGESVQPLLSRADRADPARRSHTLVQELTQHGSLSGGLTIPHAIAPIEIRADLRTMIGEASVLVDAPDLKRASARLNWLLRQLRDAPPSLRIDATFQPTRRTTSELLSTLRETPGLLIDPVDRPPRSFRVTMSANLGSSRKRGKSGFIDGVDALVSAFYRDVVQQLRPWTAPAPRLRSEDADERSAAAPTRGAPVMTTAPDEEHVEPAVAGTSSDERVGRVTRVFSDLNVAGVELVGDLRLGDWIRFGEGADAPRQRVSSMELDHARIEEGRAGQHVGIKLEGECGVGDAVFRSRPDRERMV